MKRSDETKANVLLIYFTVWLRFTKSMYWEKLFGRRVQSHHSKGMMKKVAREKILCYARGPPLIRVQLQYSISHPEIYICDLHFTHQTVWLTATDSRHLAGFPKAYLCNYYAAHWETGHWKYMSQKTIEFCAMW